MTWNPPTPLSLSIPEFARETLHTSTCSPCHYHYQDDDVCGIGIARGQAGKVWLSLNVACRRCHTRRSLHVHAKPMGIRELVAELAMIFELEDFYNLAWESWRAQSKTDKAGMPETLPQRLTTLDCLSSDGEGWSDRRCKLLSFLSTLEPSGIVMRVQGYLRDVPLTKFQVLGGYHCADEVFVLHRIQRKNVVPSDGILKLGSGNKVMFRGFNGDQLQIPDWPRFKLLKAGTTFQLNNRRWTKLSMRRLRSLLGSAPWTHVFVNESRS